MIPALRSRRAVPAPSLVTSEVALSWALFAGVALLMLGNGLHGSLVGLRASLEGFATATTGVVMSAYYVGFLAGASHAPALLERVGHIRVFSALASMASASMLLYVVWVNPGTWIAIRLVAGFCIAGLFVVAESWLNDRATNETRGRLLAIYMVVLMGSLGLGQLLLNAADPLGFKLFVLTSVLVSVAVIPMALTARPGPALVEIERIGVRELFHVVPLGVVGSTLTGLTHGTLFGLGAVYGVAAGFSRGEIAGFMAATILGGVALQIPLGRLSDLTDRRLVIGTISLGSAGLALAATLVTGIPVALSGVMALMGGGIIPLYALAVAHANDYLARSQMIGASATLVLVSGAGAAAGPFVTAIVMGLTAPAAFFWVLAGAHTILGVYAFYRTTRRARARDDRRVHAEPLVSRGTIASLHLSEELHPEES